MVGHVFLYNAGVRRVKQLLDAGRLGRVYYVSMVRTNLGPIRTDVNAAWDLASHDISIVNYWLGAEPKSASALGGSWINEGIEDVVFATLRYPGEVLVNLHVSWLNPRKARDITVVGEKRMLTFDDMNLSESLRIYDKRVTDERTPMTYVDSFASFPACVPRRRSCSARRWRRSRRRSRASAASPTAWAWRTAPTPWSWRCAPSASVRETR